MVVYLDLVFLINFLIDGTLLMTTAWTRKVRTKLWRIAAASLIGASYVVMMFFPALSFLFTFMVKIIFSIFMIITVFGFGSLQHFVSNMATFYFVNFVAAGGMFALLYLFQSPGEVMNGIWFSHSGGMNGTMKIGFIFMVVSFSAMIWFYRKVFVSSKRREGVAQYFAEVRVYVGDYESSCTGLIDTGNRLYDPLTRTPVMVMEAAEWKDVLPDSWMKRIRTSEVDQIVSAMGVDEFVWQDRLRLVPYRGVNKGTQFMLAIKPDKVVIIRNSDKIEAHKVLIGLDGGKLCSDGSYQAIIHPTLIEHESAKCKMNPDLSAFHREL